MDLSSNSSSVISRAATSVQSYLGLLSRTSRFAFYQPQDLSPGLHDNIRFVNRTALAAVSRLN